MSQLLVAPVRLELAREELASMRVTGNKEVARLMALAECNFRLAVHADTAPRRAVELLQEAMKIDGANPKYAYHAGRIHFLLGEFSAAARWLRLACCLAPTSHRIWTHVAILLQELNDVYRGDENYEPNVLLQRAEKISQAIQAGEDHIDPELLDFVPPKSRAAQEKEAWQGQQGRRTQPAESKPEDELRPSAAVRRYLHARKCRWSGIDHLSIERLLRGRPTQANVRTMAPILEELATTASQRPGRPAAIAILLVQWLLSGYPVETVRRLMTHLPADLPSSELLDTVCRIFEAPSENVADHIAAAVDEGQLSPLVAALVHRQRLLWRPLEFRSLGAYRAAHTLLAEGKQSRDEAGTANQDEERTEAIRDLTRRLERATSALKATPPKPLKDELPKAKKSPHDPQALLRRFEAFEAAATSLTGLKDEAFRLLKDQLEPRSKDLDSADGSQQVAVDHEAAEQVVTTFAESVESCLNQFEALADALPGLSGVTLPEDIASRRETCIAQFQSISNFGKFRKVLKRVEKRLRAADVEPPNDSSTLAPEGEWTAVLSAIAAVVPREEDVSLSGAPHSLAERLTAAEEASTIVEEVRDAVSEFIRQRLVPNTSDPADREAIARASADVALVESLLTTLRSTAEAELEQLEAMAAELAEAVVSQTPQDCDERLEQARNRFRSAMSLGSLKRRLRRIVKKIESAGEAFDEGSPSEDLQALAARLEQVHADGDSEAAAARGDSVTEWVEEAAALHDRMGEDWKLLKGCVQRQREGELTEGEQSQLGELRRRFDSAMATAERRIDEILAVRQSGTSSASDVEHLEAAEQYFLKVLKVRGKFQKNFARLPQSNAAFQAEIAQSNGEPPPQSQPQKGEPAHGQDAPPEPAPPKPRDEMSPDEHLEYALLRADWSVNRMFSESLETFDVYPAWLRTSPPFEALRRHILSRLAETTYRLGHRRRARATWNRLLRVNRLSHDVLKNIAVCDTVEGDVSRSLTSWREYVELLYLFDVLSGSPRDHAKARAEFHRALGNAYAPAFLSAPYDHEWKERVDPASLISFLSSPGRFRNFLEHRLLEDLNTRFQFQSPSLVLGIKRVECESRLDEAAKSTTELARNLQGLLPGRVAEQFTKLAEETIAQTAAQCRQTSRLVLEATPLYEEEEKEQIKLLARMFDIKLKLVIAFGEHVNMVKNISSLGFLKELNRLDAIPLQLSPGLFPIVANTMGLDAETLTELTETLRLNVIVSLMKYLLEDDDPAERSTRQRQYRLLTSTWLRDEQLRHCARLVDTPQPQFMPEEVAEAMVNDRMDVSLPTLRRWHDEYPAMAGLAVMIANCLFKQREFDEARQRLERSRDEVFYEPTRRHINYLLVQILLRELEKPQDEEDYEEVLRIILKAVRLDDFQPNLVKQTLQLFTAISQQKGLAARRREVTAAVEGWLQRAAELHAEGDQEDDSIPRPSQEDIEDVRNAYLEVMEKLS